MKAFPNFLTIASMAIGLSVGSTSAVAGQASPWSENVIDRSKPMKALQGRLNQSDLEALIALGEKLFVGKFTDRDGAGRPKATQAIIPTKKRHSSRSKILRLPGPDASACSSCHNDPVVGGAGDVTANVFVSEGFTNADFDTTDPQFSNERNTNHLMGAGLIELLAREMTKDLIELRNGALRKAREDGKSVVVGLTTKSVNFGQLTAHPDGLVDLSKIEGVDTDLNIRPFGQKGVFTSLRQFTVNAMNHHHGMQATERFGQRWTGEADFDGDGIINELIPSEISALVAWQATLPMPERIKPKETRWAEYAKRGEALFDQIGCVTCHRSSLPLANPVFSDPGPLDAAGTLRANEDAIDIEYDLSKLEWFNSLPRNTDGHVLIPLYSDLKRHKISDQKNSHFGNELLAQRFVERDQFQTTELWGLGSSAPYGHRGDLSTIDAAIRAHGGNAAEQNQAYLDLSDDDQQAIIAFLKTLVIGQ